MLHDFKVGLTTALILGYNFQLHQFNGPSKLPPPLVTFVEQIKKCEHLWSHYFFFFPCLFLITHVRRARVYIMEDLSRHITLVEQSAGVTQAARSQRSDFIRPKDRTEVDSHQLFVDGHLQREHARRMTQSINGLSTRIIFAKRSPQWDTDCVKFLLRLLGNSQRLLAYRSIHGQASRETLDYVQNYSEARLEVTQTSESRIQHQLNIVCL